MFPQVPHCQCKLVFIADAGVSSYKLCRLLCKSHYMHHGKFLRKLIFFPDTCVLQHYFTDRKITVLSIPLVKFSLMTRGSLPRKHFVFYKSQIQKAGKMHCLDMSCASKIRPV